MQNETSVELHVDDESYFDVTFGKKGKYEISLDYGEIAVRVEHKDQPWGEEVFRGSYKDFVKALKKGSKESEENKSTLNTNAVTLSNYPF